MIGNLALGLALATTTVIIHTLGLTVLTEFMTRFVALCGLLRFPLGRAVATVLTVLGIFAIHTAEIWVWAAAYLALGIMPDMNTALYFSLTTFATVGFGDVVPPPAWRLLVGVEGMSGFILIGWSTAYLVAAYARYGRSLDH